MSWYSEYYKRKNRKDFEKFKKREEFFEKPIESSVNNSDLMNSYEFKPSFNGKKISETYDEKPVINTKMIIAGAIIAALFILILLHFLSKSPDSFRFSRLDFSVKNVSGIPISVIYDNKNLFTLSLFESELKINNTKDRLFGSSQYRTIVFDEKGKAYSYIILDNEIRVEPLNVNPEKTTNIGWYYNVSDIEIKNEDSKNKKMSRINLKNSDNKISSSDFTITLDKKNQFLKLVYEFNPSDNILTEFSYGLLFNNWDIILPNSTLIKNDNNITTKNEKINIYLYQKNKTQVYFGNIYETIKKEKNLDKNIIERKGSFYVFENIDYQIFINRNKSIAVVVFSSESLEFQNHFSWNVFRAKVKKGNVNSYNKFNPLYFIILENPNFSYDDFLDDWIIDSRKYSGSLGYHINEIIYKDNE
jgi:hypothetical protein